MHHQAIQKRREYRVIFLVLLLVCVLSGAVSDPAGGALSFLLVLAVTASINWLAGPLVVARRSPGIE